MDELMYNAGRTLGVLGRNLGFSALYAGVRDGADVGPSQAEEEAAAKAAASEKSDKFFDRLLTFIPIIQQLFAKGSGGQPNGFTMPGGAMAGASAQAPCQDGVCPAVDQKIAHDDVKIEYRESGALTVKYPTLGLAAHSDNLPRALEMLAEAIRNSMKPFPAAKDPNAS